MRNIFRFLTPKSHVAYLEEDATLRNGLEKMRHHGYSAIPVISKQGKYLGTVTEGDFLWHLLQKNHGFRELEKASVTEVMRECWNPPVYAYETERHLIMRLAEQNFVPVVDDRGVFIGIVTRKAVLEQLVPQAEEQNLHCVNE